MKHEIHRIHFVAKHARSRVRACLGRSRGGTPRPADTDEVTYET
ncbi:MAG: hypothetical protein WC100_10480 [Sterolibacterium sp.]